LAARFGFFATAPFAAKSGMGISTVSLMARSQSIMFRRFIYVRMAGGREHRRLFL
jgi:hypothetical protein